MFSVAGAGGPVRNPLPRLVIPFLLPSHRLHPGTSPGIHAFYEVAEKLFA